MAEVRVAYDVSTDSYLVYAWIPLGDGTRHCMIYREPWIIVSPGAEMPPFLKLDREIAQALGIQDDLARQKGTATERHLEDAIKTRDWGLSLIERLAQPITKTITLPEVRP
jgi:hypothetical protein